MWRVQLDVGTHHFLILRWFSWGCLVYMRNVSVLPLRRFRMFVDGLAWHCVSKNKNEQMGMRVHKESAWSPSVSAAWLDISKPSESSIRQPTSIMMRSLWTAVNKRLPSYSSLFFFSSFFFLVLSGNLPTSWTEPTSPCDVQFCIKIHRLIIITEVTVSMVKLGWVFLPTRICSFCEPFSHFGEG